MHQIKWKSNRTTKASICLDASDRPLRIPYNTIHASLCRIHTHDVGATLKRFECFNFVTCQGCSYTDYMPGRTGLVRPNALGYRGMLRCTNARMSTDNLSPCATVITGCMLIIHTFVPFCKNFPRSKYVGAA